MNITNFIDSKVLMVKVLLIIFISVSTFKAWSLPECSSLYLIKGLGVVSEATPEYITVVGGKTYVTQISNFSEGGINVEVVNSYQVHKSIFSDGKRVRKALPRAYRNRIFRSLIGILSEQYPRRGWDSEFIDKTSSNILDLLFQSKIILVTDESTGEELGSMRLLSSAYTHSAQEGAMPLPGESKIFRLPVEHFFSQNIPRESLSPVSFGLKTSESIEPVSLQSIFEVSSLAIKKGKYGQKIRGLILKYFIYLSYQPFYAIDNERENSQSPLYSMFHQFKAEENRGKPQLLAYGDEAGGRLYLPVGFFKRDKMKLKRKGVRWDALEADLTFWSRVTPKLELQALVLEALELVSDSGINPYNGHYIGSDRDLRESSFLGEYSSVRKVFELFGVSQ